MYRAFNLTLNEALVAPTDSGKDTHFLNREEVKLKLDSFVADGIVKGGKLSDYWFPKSHYDVFISHSHLDEGDAIGFASWLTHHFGLRVFVDSSVWGYADDLLKSIDNEFCRKLDSNNYYYEKRNGSTSLVHMMLANSLCEMLDQSECVFFLNSPNSISTIEAVDKTRSPWLFYELGLMRVLRRPKPERLKIKSFVESQRSISEALNLVADFEVPLDELTPITSADLLRWLEGCARMSRRKGEALDVLYKQNPE